MSFNKHNSRYAIYSVWCGREEGPHQLVEECHTLDEVYSKVENYVGPNVTILVVDIVGNIIERHNWKKYEYTTKNK